MVFGVAVYLDGESATFFILAAINTEKAREEIFMQDQPHRHIPVLFIDGEQIGRHADHTPCPDRYLQRLHSVKGPCRIDRIQDTEIFDRVPSG